MTLQQDIKTLLHNLDQYELDETGEGFLKEAVSILSSLVTGEVTTAVLLGVGQDLNSCAWAVGDDPRILYETIGRLQACQAMLTKLAQEIDQSYEQVKVEVPKPPQGGIPN